jgi:hypothetical protein
MEQTLTKKAKLINNTKNGKQKDKNGQTIFTRGSEVHL